MDSSESKPLFASSTFFSFSFLSLFLFLFSFPEMGGCHVMSCFCFALLTFDRYVIQHSRMNACLYVCNKLCVQHGRLASFAVA